MANGIHYRIGASRPGAHVFEVSCRVEEPDPAGQRFTLPAWIPGSYLVRDYARHVLSFAAFAGEEEVVVRKLDKATWRCAPCAGPLTVRYEVYAFDMSVRGAYIDTARGFFNGVCVFVAVDGRENQAVTVDIEAPEGADDDWRVATTMTPEGADAWGFGRYAAADYDELIDHPVEMGCFDVVEYDAAGVQHCVVLCGRHHANRDRLATDLARICDEHVAMFGELPHMQGYMFLTRVLGEGYGGLEHRSSSALVCRRDELPDDSDKVSKPYRRFLGLASHEYFHLWNVKRIKPAVFTPYKLDAESHTELLWVFEGITSYYDDLALVRSGVIDASSYFSLVSDTIARVLSVPGFRSQSLADSSFDAWTKFYKPTETSPNAVVSYYAKGAMAALALDIVIRERSDDEFSLDDVMRAMWQTYGRTGQGVPEDGFEELCCSVTGLDLTPFFNRAIRGTGDLEIEARLAALGIKLAPDPRERPRSALGFKLKKGTTHVGTVFNGGAAEAAGLSAGDELVALDGLKVSPDGWRPLVRHYTPGDTATLHAFRRDELMAFEVTFDLAPSRRWKLVADEEAPTASVARREAWLLSSTLR